jgi:ABC-type transport system involved in multi-copper enzyme maturation permease subunit
VRDASRPLPFARAARGVFDLALEGMVWSRRSLMMALLLGLPVAFGILYRAVLVAKLPTQVSAADLYGVIVTVSIRFLVPLAALFYATALIADEVEGKTLTYLLTRPIQRSAILTGKFAACLATTLALSLPSLVVTFFLLMSARGWDAVGPAVPDLFRDMGVVALALLAYGALFTLLGVVLKRPMIPGLLFVFVWEMVANLPGYLPRFTITAYLRSLVRHRPPAEGFSEMFGQVLPVALSLEVLAAMVVVFLGLATWIFSTREYVMEQ